MYRPPPSLIFNSIELQGTDSKDSSAVAPSGNSAVCQTTFRDFPNSLDNSAICNKVESHDGKTLPSGELKFDWLRKNWSFCKESRDFFNNFLSKSCGAAWCDFAAPQLADWAAEANSSGVDGCRDLKRDGITVETERRCKTVKNKLKAAEFLQCSKSGQFISSPAQKVP